MAANPSAPLFQGSGKLITNGRPVGREKRAGANPGCGDGRNSTRPPDVSDDVVVGEPFTRVVIVQPRPAKWVPEGKPIPLLAIAQNVEEGVLSLTGSNTRWIWTMRFIVGNGNDIVFEEIELTTPLGNGQRRRRRQDHTSLRVE